MAILMGVTPCVICHQIINPGDLVFGSWWGTQYDEAPMHWHCYVGSRIRKECIQSNLKRQLTYFKYAYPNLKIVQPTEPFFLILVDMNKQKVMILSMD